MSSTRIGQVRIRTDTDDPLAARMRGDAALRALDLEPPGMPARMILCIRSMADPLPGGLDLRSSHAPRATEWERAARSAISDALRRAVHVVDGPVPATADAVLFADRAELLACAARDAIHAGGGWWWRDTIRGGLAWMHVIREWMRAPQYVPAALELLVRGGDAIPFLRALDMQQASELTMNVLRIHALETLARSISESLSTATPASRRGITPPPRLQAIVPEILNATVPAIATIEQRIFAVITLAARRAPAIVRSEKFVHEVRAWIAPPPTASNVSPTRVSEEMHERHVSDETHERRTRASQEHESPAPETQRSRAAAPAAAAWKAVAAATALQNVESQPSPGVEHAEPTTPTPPPLQHDQLPTAQASTPKATPETIHADYAGLFFLLNLAVALGYYDPYGRDEPLALDVWDFLALTGRALVPGIEEDAMWPLLAQLANREEDDELPELDEEILTRVRDALSLVIEDHEDPAAFVIRRPGHIVLSPAHIDVTFCLAAHPIEIRVAGLDRDPGWIPAAGRHVDFHFD